MAFSIVETSITVLSPNRGETWQVGKTYDITWRATNLVNKTGYVILQKAGMSGINLAENYDLSLGKFTWTVNIAGYSSTGNDFKIYVGRGNVEPSVSDTSDAPFSIVAAGFGLNDLTNQLADISQAVSKLIEKVTNLIGR